MATLLQIRAQCFNSKTISSSTPQNGKNNRLLYGSTSCSSSFYTRLRVRAVKEKTEEIKNSSSAEEIMKKYDIKAGLWKIFSSKETTKSKGDEAKELVAKYGGAYLATSVTLSLISFGLCYALLRAGGVDVPSLLQKVGISTNETGGKVGSFALAYAAHKAASPIRFLATVALTPVVASWIGKKVRKMILKKKKW